jgi:hypothetical protein
MLGPTEKGYPEVRVLQKQEKEIFTAKHMRAKKH